MAKERMSQASRRNVLKSAAVGTSIGLAGCSEVIGGGAEYPSEPLTIIVPYAEGGGIDGYTRIISEPLSEELGVDVKVNNIPGENPVPGMNELISNPEDSYQIGMVGHTGLVGSALIFADWAPSELTAVGTVGKLAISCYGNDKYDWQGLSDMINRFDSGEFSQVASIGVGTPFHIASLVARERVDWQWEEWVPYEGAAPSSQAVLQDEVPFGVIASVVLQPHYQADTGLDIIGTFPSDGDSTMPKVQSWGEAGLTSIDDVSNIFVGAFAGPGIPSDVRNTLNEALQNIMDTDAIAEQREQTGLLIDTFLSAEELTEIVTELETEIPNLVDLNRYGN